MPLNKSETKIEKPQNVINSPTEQPDPEPQPLPDRKSETTTQAVTQPQGQARPSLSDKPRFVCFFGKRGAGKTTAIGGQLQDCRPPVIILDILGNFDNPEYFQCSKISDALQELNKQVREDRYKIISLKTADPSLAVDYCSAALWENHGGTIILDEVDAFNISESPCFDQLIRYGRNENVSIITGCRRPAEISKNITAAANSIWALKTNEPRDCMYFEQIFGDRAYELMRLPNYHGVFIDYDLSELGLFRIDEGGRIFKLKSDRF